MTSIKTKKEIEILKKINDLIIKYNNSVCFLNKSDSFNKYIFIIDKNKKTCVKNLRICIKQGIKINTLDKIILTMKTMKNPDYSLLNLWKSPENFINNEQCLISFRCLKLLCSEFKIILTDEILIEKWFLNLFNKSDSIYISKTKFLEELNKSNGECELPTIKKDIQKQLIINAKKKICISEKFSNITHYTSLYLDKLQKTLGLKIKELFYDTINNKQINYNLEKKEISNFIDSFENNNNITFDDKQKNAIYNSINNKFSILTGYPGTGKSEILNCVCQYLNKAYSNICLSAPTGLATNNLIERCKFDSKNQLINSNLFRLIQVIFPKILYSMNIDTKKRDNLIKLNYDKLGNIKSEDDQLKIRKDIDDLEYYKYCPEIIIVDESSMINLELFSKLIYFVEKFDSRLIIVGDENQLPPIGGGSPFHDIIKCKLFNIDKLTNIYRNNGSLCQNIIKMNNQIIYKHNFDDKSIEFYNIEKFINKNKLNIPLFTKFINNNDLNKNNCKFLTPQKDHLFGYNNINNLLQKIFNSKGKIIFNENSYSNYKTFRENDYLIRIVNNYDENKCNANGDTCKIVQVVNGEYDKVFIKYDKDDTEENKGKNILVETSVTNLQEEFDLSYCLSIHKSQGHGFDNIVLFISKQHNYMWNNLNSRKLLYTAISRAKKRCIIIGDYDMFIKSQKNKNIEIPSIFMKKFN